MDASKCKEENLEVFSSSSCQNQPKIPQADEPASCATEALQKMQRKLNHIHLKNKPVGLH